MTTLATLEVRLRNLRAEIVKTRRSDRARYIRPLLMAQACLEEIAAARALTLEDARGGPTREEQGLGVE